MKQKIFFLLAMLFCITLQTMAQTDDDKPENKEVDMDAPTFEPMVKVGKVLLAKGNHTKAAEILKIGRTTLYNLKEKYGIE